jgi:hypothetical protein
MRGQLSWNAWVAPRTLAAHAQYTRQLQELAHRHTHLPGGQTEAKRGGEGLDGHQRAIVADRSRLQTGSLSPRRLGLSGVISALSWRQPDRSSEKRRLTPVAGG